MIQHLQELVNLITSLVAPEIVVTCHSADVLPALEDGHLVVWVLPPETITFPTLNRAEFELAPVIISPQREDPLTGLGDIEDLLAILVDPLDVTEAVLDSLQIGSSAAWPAAQMKLTTLLERN